MTARADASVRKTITVRAGAERAFRVFTAEIDAWWPHDHHIGAGTPKKGYIQGHVGGRCYTEYNDGSETDWGRVTVWEPPHRLVLAWLIDAHWHSDPDLSRASEVEIQFTPQGDGTTRVDVEHRNFERMGEGGNNMRMAVDSPAGWNGLLQLYAGYLEKGGAQ